MRYCGFGLEIRGWFGFVEFCEGLKILDEDDTILIFFGVTLVLLDGFSKTDKSRSGFMNQCESVRSPFVLNNTAIHRTHFGVEF